MLVFARHCAVKVVSESPVAIPLEGQSWNYATQDSKDLWSHLYGAGMLSFGQIGELESQGIQNLVASADMVSLASKHKSGP